MADIPISALPDGGAAIAPDEFPVNRGGVTHKVVVSSPLAGSTWYQEGNAAPTVITVQDTPTDIVCALALGDGSADFVPVGNVFTYTGINPGNMYLQWNFSTMGVGGGINTFRTTVRKNGIQLEGEAMFSASNTAYGSHSMVVAAPIVTNDEISLMVENVGGVEDIIFVSQTIIIAGRQT
jgi:hypothetical protein